MGVEAPARPPGHVPLVAVIPAGGAGTRLWPWSNRARPKHLLDLTGSGRSLLQETYDRVRPLAEEVYVLTEARQVEPILAQLPELPRDRVIVEPVARGTTSALGLAALTLAERDPGALMLSLPADHVVKGRRAFGAAIKRSARLAAATDRLVTIGLRPTYPATGFGYIRTAGRFRGGGVTALKVDRFVEKPSLARARGYLAEGDHYWNLAMFSWRVGVFLEELARYSPRHYRGLRRVLAARRAGEEVRAARLYARLPADAVDNTIMERTEKLVLVPGGFEWVDVGSWSELHSLLPKDGGGNVLRGDPVLVDAEGSFISAPGKAIAVIGVKDLVVIDTEEALLVVPRERAQEVKSVVDRLKARGKTRYL